MICRIFQFTNSTSLSITWFTLLFILNERSLPNCDTWLIFRRFLTGSALEFTPSLACFTTHYQENNKEQQQSFLRILGFILAVSGETDLMGDKLSSGPVIQHFPISGQFSPLWCNSRWARMMQRFWPCNAPAGPPLQLFNAALVEQSTHCAPTIAWGPLFWCGRCVSADAAQGFLTQQRALQQLWVMENEISWTDLAVAINPRMWKCLSMAQ